MTPSTSWPSSSGAPPLYATPRNPALKSDGPLVDVIARNLGTPFIPWQRYTSEVANERRPDGSYEHQIVVVSVPRQTGKTTLIRAEGTHRCLVCRRDVFYTAQTGKDARARWMDLVKALRLNAALANKVNVALRGGSEHVEFPGGSVFQVFAPTPESLHGYTPPTVMLDEVFSLTPGEGELLMGAIGPAQITIRDKQIWIVSTAGTAQSTFLHDWIDRAAEGTPRVAGFIWGAGDHHDPYDPADIAKFHPGVGFELNGKVLEATDVLEQVDRNTRAEYERAYANRRTLTAAHLISPEDWQALGPDAGTDLAPPASRADCVLTYDVSVDRRAGAIAATWSTADGKVASKIVRSGAGYDWMPDALDELARTWRTHKPIHAPGNGPVLDVTRRARDLGVDVVELGPREFATATTAFLDAIDNRTLAHDGHPDLERSATGLVTRVAVGDGVAVSRRHSVGNTAPAVAVLAGVYVATTDRDTQRPVLVFG